MCRNCTPVASAFCVGLSTKIFTSGAPAKKYSTVSGTHSAHTRYRPARKPLRMRSGFCAPRFCAVKFEMPLPSVTSDVMTRLFSLTDAE